MTEPDTQYLQDRADILNLFGDYALALAKGDWDRYASIWAETVEIYVPVHIGPDVQTMTGAEFAKSIADTRELTNNRHHVQSSHHVTVDGDSAVVESLQTYRFERPTTNGGSVYTGGGNQVFNLTRTSDGWKINRMEYYINYQDGNWSVIGDLL